MLPIINNGLPVAQDERVRLVNRPGVNATFEPLAAKQSSKGSKLMKMDDGRPTMYLQPLGDFDPAWATVTEATADLLGCFYGVPVRMPRCGAMALHDAPCEGTLDPLMAKPPTV